MGNVSALSALYIAFNTDNFKGDSHGVFIQNFQGEQRTLLRDDIRAVLEDEQLFVPTIPPRDYFRNIEDDIEYFDDEYDDFVQRIERRHETRYLERHRDVLLLDERETLALDPSEEDDRQYLEQRRKAQQ